MKPVSSAIVSAAFVAGLFCSPVFAQTKPAAPGAQAILATANSATNAPDPGAGKFASEIEKHSYSMGVLLAGDFKRQLSRGSYEHDPEVVIRAFSEALRGKQTLITDGEANVILRNYSSEVRKKMEEKRKAEGDKAKAAGEAFLAENRKKDGVKVTASGLQYEVLKQGEGAKPTTNDVVQVHYRGTLIDGTEFDSSYGRGEPASFGLGRVIKGWTEALQLMPVGSKYRLAIPSDLAYGPNGSPPKIAPNSALVFEVELIGIRPTPPSPPNPIVTSDIIKVPSADELKKGAQIEVIKASDAERLQKEAEEQKKKLDGAKK
jgi:FKBP-type peptidyl-prolyl cis-trans isomerase